MCKESETARELIGYIDILVDGEFIEERNITDEDLSKAVSIAQANA